MRSGWFVVGGRRPTCSLAHAPSPHSPPTTHARADGCMLSPLALAERVLEHLEREGYLR